MEIQNNGYMIAHLKEIKEGLLDYFFHMNDLTNQNRYIFRSTKIPCELPMKRLSNHLMELNNYLPSFQ